MAGGAGAAAAVEQHRLAVMHCDLCLLQPRQRQVPRAGDVLAGMFIRLAHINQGGTVA